MADTHEAKKGESTPNKATLQSYIQNFSKEAIDTIIEILRTTRNENLKMGAAKVIIDKSIPDIKAMEITGKDGEPIKFNLISGADYLAYISKLREIKAPSDRGIAESPSEIQGTSVASQGPQDNNGNNTVSEMGAT